MKEAANVSTAIGLLKITRETGCFMFAPLKNAVADRKVFSCTDWSNRRAILLTDCSTGRCFYPEYTLFTFNINSLLYEIRSRPAPAYCLPVRQGSQQKWGMDHIFGRYAEIVVAGRGQIGTQGEHRMTH